MRKETGIKIDVDAPTIRVEAIPGETSTEIRFEAPVGWEHLVVGSATPRGLLQQIEGKRESIWYDPIMDARPEMAIISAESKDSVPIHIYSYENKLLSVSVVEISTVGKETIPVFVVSPQALLLYFLLEAHINTGERRVLATQFYLWTMEILKAATAILSSVMISPSVNMDDAGVIVRKFVNSSPFFLSTRTVGTVNHDPSYLISMARIARDIGGIQSALLDGLPSDYFPGNAGRKRPVPLDGAFPYNVNPMFRRSGGAKPN